MKKKYHIEGIDCANCAAKVEKKMNDLPDVSVTLTICNKPAFGGSRKSG